MFEESVCRVNKYCGFDVIGDYDDATVERCRYCGRKTIYKKVEGRVDNSRYLREHVRDFAQSFGHTGKVFREIYGDHQVSRNVKAVKEKKDKEVDWEGAKQDAMDDLQRWKRLEAKGYSDKEIRHDLANSSS